MASHGTDLGLQPTGAQRQLLIKVLGTARHGSEDCLRGQTLLTDSPMALRQGRIMVPRKYLKKLREELAGTLLEAGQPGYDQSLVIDNGRIDLRPGVVAMCVNREDVATAYKFALEHEMPFT